MPPHTVAIVHSKLESSTIDSTSATHLHGGKQLESTPAIISSSFVLRQMSQLPCQNVHDTMNGLIHTELGVTSDVSREVW